MDVSRIPNVQMNDKEIFEKLKRDIEIIKDKHLGELHYEDAMSYIHQKLESLKQEIINECGPHSPCPDCQNLINKINKVLI